MPNEIQILEERMEDLRAELEQSASEIESAKKEAVAAKANVVVLQKAVEILRNNANLPPEAAKEFEALMFLINVGLNGAVGS